MAHARHDEDDLISGINVTPLVDVVLVLLVVLMVTATYVTSRALPLEPPVAHGPAAPRAAFEVTIDAEGQAWLDGAAVDLPGLRAAAARYVAATPAGEVRGVVAADRRSRHGDVVSVIDALHDVHVDRFAIRVREPAP